MTTLTITIPIASEWPTSEELARRNKVEAALDASRIGQCAGAGGGLGEMHLSYRVDDDSRVPAARAKIEAAMARHMPGFQYEVEVAIQNQPVRTFQVKVGDIFAIPLAERRYALGVCRFVFQRMKGFTACRIFDFLVPEPQVVEPLPATASFDPLFVWDHSIADGTWPIIGNIQVEPSPLMYRSAGGVYNGDEYLRPDDYTEDLPNMCGLGPVAVKNYLREHFGLPSVGEGPGRTSR